MGTLGAVGRNGKKKNLSRLSWYSKYALASIT